MRTRTWVAVLVVLAIAAAATLQVTGRMTESRVRELVGALNQGGSPWKATIASYDRSWTRSTSVLRFGFGDGNDVAELRTTWQHGPMRGINIASGSSELRLLGSMAALGSQVFGDAAPATASHTVALDGSLRLGFATPAVDRAFSGTPPGRVSGTESSGTLTIDRSGRYVLAWLHPKLSVTGGGQGLEVDAVSLASAGRFGSGVFESPAQFSLAIKSIRWSEGSRSMAIADGSITCSMVPGAESIDFKLRYAAGPGHFDVAGNAHRWKRIEIQVTLADISRAAVEGYTREMRTVSELPPSDPRGLQLSLAAIANASQALLKREPVLSLDPFAFEGSDGTLSVSATARVDRALLSEGAGLLDLPQAVSVLARVSIARALARAWLAAVLRPTIDAASTAQGGPEPASTDVDRRSRAMADEVLVAAAQAGMFREGADPIVLEIVAKEGRVLVNGLSAQRLAELKAALLPDPAPRTRTFGGAPPVSGSR